MSNQSDLDLLLINPGNRQQVYQSLGAELAAIEPPVWAGLMTSFLRGKGLRVRILDAQAEDLTPAQTAEYVEEQNPLLTVVVVYGHQPSASTQNMPAAGTVCKAIKERLPQMKVLMVGGHAASLPERTLREESVDFVSSGEGLYTMLDLVQALQAGSNGKYSNVRDMWYWDDGFIRAGVPAPLIKDLDIEMPSIAWDMLPMSRYRAHNWHCFDGMQRQPYAAMYTSLGCPYHCTFCCIQAPFKSGERTLGIQENINSYRLWSPQTVIAQIDTLVNQYGVRNIKFADELFVLNQSHVIGICDLIIERGYDLNIWAYARVDSIKEKMFEKLKRAGINWLALGIESANSKVRDNIQKDFDQEYLYSMIEKTRNAGIYIIGNYIFGLPEDTEETMQQTLDTALDLNCEFANFYSTMAYPGSQLYKEAVQNNWTLPGKWSGYSQHSVDTLPLPTKHISAAQVLRFRDHAFQEYFNSPRYLEMIQQKFGVETVEHIRKMASHTLIRKYAQL